MIPRTGANNRQAIPRPGEVVQIAAMRHIIDSRSTRRSTERRFWVLVELVDEPGGCHGFRHWWTSSGWAGQHIIAGQLQILRVSDQHQEECPAGGLVRLGRLRDADDESQDRKLTQLLGSHAGAFVIYLRQHCEDVCWGLSRASPLRERVITSNMIG